MPMAMAVLPVPGCPANKIARPAILPSLIIWRMTPAALRAWFGRPYLRKRRGAPEKCQDPDPGCASEHLFVRYGSSLDSRIVLAPPLVEWRRATGGGRF
ncbi:hypothetical protein V6N11_065421 [Hibiscus sabdariffa]|uniref:Uncharacterized protein n=1 Tax=Hibiscus sabdariffa TaxID=183260 RepID=A0ABR2AA97_9ROSI